MVVRWPETAILKIKEKIMEYELCVFGVAGYAFTTGKVNFT